MYNRGHKIHSNTNVLNICNIYSVHSSPQGCGALQQRRPTTNDDGYEGQKRTTKTDKDGTTMAARIHCPEPRASDFRDVDGPMTSPTCSSMHEFHGTFSAWTNSSRKCGEHWAHHSSPNARPVRATVLAQCAPHFCEGSANSSKLKKNRTY